MVHSKDLSLNQILIHSELYFGNWLNYETVTKEALEHRVTEGNQLDSCDLKVN